MTRALPEAEIHHLRRFDLSVVIGHLLVSHVSLDGLINTPASGMPEHHAGSLFLGVEKIEFFGDLAMVTLLGLFNAGEIRLELFLVGPSSAVNALQLLIVSVAAPVSTGNLGQLECLQFTRAGDMGPATEIHPLTLLVDRDFLVARQVLNDLHLVVLAHVTKDLDGLFARAHNALNGQIVCSDLQHALLDIFEVFRRKVMTRRKVVVKAVLNRRTYGDLRTGKELLHGLC